jgi:hypothetical protein
VLERF